MNIMAARYKRRFPQISELKITNSKRAGKRFCAKFTLNGVRRTVHFGLDGAYTYYDGASPEKRNSYLARASKIKNASGKYTYLIPGTANSFAYWLLWN